MTDPKRNVPLWQFLVSILGLTLVFFMVVVAIVKIDHREEREDAQQDMDQSYLSCLRGNEIRQVQIENEGEPSRPLDLTVLPSVQHAPQWFQDVVAELKQASEYAASQPIDPNSRTGRRIARIKQQVRDCESEWRTHTPGLTLPHESGG